MTADLDVVWEKLAMVESSWVFANVLSIDDEGYVYTFFQTLSVLTIAKYAP